MKKTREQVLELAKSHLRYDQPPDMDTVLAFAAALQAEPEPGEARSHVVRFGDTITHADGKPFRISIINMRTGHNDEYIVHALPGRSPDQTR